MAAASFVFVWLIPWRLCTLVELFVKPVLELSTTSAELGFFTVGVLSSCVLLGFKLWHKTLSLSCFSSGLACVVVALTCGIQVWCDVAVGYGYSGRDVKVGFQVCNVLALKLCVGLAVRFVALSSCLQDLSGPISGSVRGDKVVCCGLRGQSLAPCRCGSDVEAGCGVYNALALTLCVGRVVRFVAHKFSCLQELSGPITSSVCGVKIECCGRHVQFSAPCKPAVLDTMEWGDGD